MFPTAPPWTCSTASMIDASGTGVTLTATPAADSLLTGWSGCGSATETTCTVTLEQAKSVTVIFTKQQYPLTVLKAGNGSGTVASQPAGITCGSDCSENYASGVKVKLTAKASRGSTFAGWSGSCGGRSLTCQVTLSKTRAVTAIFNRRSATAADELLELINSSESGVDDLGFDLLPQDNRP